LEEGVHACTSQHLFSSFQETAVMLHQSSMIQHVKRAVFGDTYLSERAAMIDGTALRKLTVKQFLGRSHRFFS